MPVFIKFLIGEKIIIKYVNHPSDWSLIYHLVSALAQLTQLCSDESGDDALEHLL